jgi:FAD/FMN-containing dehydrogenase
VAGLVQGGGFGSFSKTWGLAAANLLEAEIVTADGAIRIVNASREPDLFWALKGGGGGTFGVVTRLTLRTHDLPETFGAIRFTIKANSDQAFLRLIARFVDLYAETLFNPSWGEQVHAMADNRLICEMSFQGLDEFKARSAWQALEAFVVSQAADYAIHQPLTVVVAPARHYWDIDYFRETLPSAIIVDDRPGARPRDWWWAGDGAQAGALWHGYTSAWLPAELLSAHRRAELVDAWFAASRQWTVSLHFNKGLAGASAAARAASRNTSMNPQVLDAFALAIIASEGPSSFPQLPSPNLRDVAARAQRIHAAMAALKQAAPRAGAYLSECDYFEQNWQQTCWGAHWERLSSIKRRYDPEGIFIVHHGVGSEAFAP